MAHPFRFLDSSLPEVASRVRRPDAHNIVFGAEAAGQILAARLLERGIAVAAFCDNSPAKIDREFNGLPVFRPEDAAHRHPGANFFIALASVNWVDRQLAAMGVTEALSVHAGALSHPGDDRQWTDEERHRFELVLRAQDFFIYRNDSPVERHPFDRVELAITERCSLRCRDCCNFMQYFTNPATFSLAGLLQTIDRLSAAAERLVMFHIIGGEPLIHPEFHLAALHAARKTNIARVKVLTNATILPTAEQIAALRGSGVAFKITDYGVLSRNRDRLVELLDANDIPWEIINHGVWRRMDAICRRGDGRARLNRILYQCPVGSFCYTAVKGRLFRCPFAAHATSLGAIPDTVGDSVDLAAADSPADLPDVRKRICELLVRKDVMTACDYCPYGLPGEDVPAAVQASEVLPFEKAPSPCRS